MFGLEICNESCGVCTYVDNVLIYEFKVNAFNRVNKLELDWNGNVAVHLPFLSRDRREKFPRENPEFAREFKTNHKSAK